MTDRKKSHKKPTKTKHTQADPVLTSRLCYLDLFTEIYHKKNPMDQVLDRDKTYLGLEARDRAFIHLLLATTFRCLVQIDAIIEICAQPPKGKSLDKRLKDILRLGICQLVFVESAEHAAVDTAVEITKLKPGLGKTAGLVNAVLRRVIREKESLKEAVSSLVNCPDWLYQIWVTDYGQEHADRIVLAHLNQAPLDLQIKNKDPKTKEAFADIAECLETGTYRLTHNAHVTELPFFEEGGFWVQDFSSALPVKMMHPISKKTIIDLCAAPGGKTAQLCDAGAHVIAVDRSANRMKRLDENMQRLGFRPESVISDALAWKPENLVDGVLLDAPCSATGTIRRHPDMPYQKKPEDIEKLSDLQARLLDHAAQMIKSGGMLIYCTCSLQKMEGEDQVASFLERHSDFSISPITKNELDGLDMLINKDGFIRALPFYLEEKGGMDGFFVARLIKK